MAAAAVALCLAVQPLQATEREMPSGIREVKARHVEALMALPGVVSVGIGRDAEGRPAIVVGLDGPRPETVERLPAELEGYPVVVQKTGPLKAR